MARIIIEIPGEVGYEVRIDRNIIEELGAMMRHFDPMNGKALVITDSNVAPLYLEQTKAALAKLGYNARSLTVPAGERSKSLECAGEIWDAMSALRLDRDSVVVALGGGVVGDLAGFVASTYMRGIRVVQVPTTLLSMVDSSVGGKTAINLALGKNLVGTFWQPRYVCADIDTLATLDQREWACGCGEIAKSALIDSDEFFFWLVENASALAARDPQVTIEAVKRSVAFKARIVVQDKSESKGVRECLNYGHTLAHAIEKAAGYGTYSHGAAVAQGMRFAARLGAALKGTPVELVAAQDELLDTLGLPDLGFKADPQQLLDLMMGDKKVRGGALRFVLPKDVGDWSVTPVDPELVLEHLTAWQSSLA